MALLSQTQQQNAICSAKELFWRNGYEETSVEQLVKATGLNRYGLYNTFGAKLDVFLATLEDYYIERKSLFMRVLGDPDRGPLDAIWEVSEFCIREMTDRNAGCLMSNVANEVAQNEPTVAKRVETYLHEIHNAKAGALALAAERGELNPAISPDQGASILMSNMLGSGVMARNGASRERLLGTLDACMRAISNPRNGDCDSFNQKVLS